MAAYKHRIRQRHDKSREDEADRKRRYRKFRRLLFQVGPCSSLLLLCWMIITVQKRHTDFHHLQGMDKNDHDLKLTSLSSSSSDTVISDGSASSMKNLRPIDKYPFYGLSDLSSPKSMGQTFTGLYWHIPKGGGTTLKYIMGNCLNLVQASRASVDWCDVETNELHVCKTKFGAYVNADTSDNHGIQRANDLGLIPSGLTDVVVSSRFLHVASLFDEKHSARAFTVIRDPSERVVSTFYYLQKAHWERHYDKKFKDMTLLDYINGEDTSSNWMVRILTGKYSAPTLTEQDLEFAKEILQRKFFILLTNSMQEGVDRLVRFMGWEANDDIRACVEKNLGSSSKHANKNSHPPIEVGSPEWEALREKNGLDQMLYEYALQLYSQQLSLLP